MVRSFLLCLAASLVVVTAMIAEETQKEKLSPGSVAYLDSPAVATKTGTKRPWAGSGGAQTCAYFG